MAPDKNNEARKSSVKTETIILKVFIHCEGCKKKVKKILSQIKGVQTVDADAKLGKVTVVGAVDPKVLIEKLEKAGKIAEVLPSGGGGGGGGGKLKELQKEQEKEAKKVRFEVVEGVKQGTGGGGNESSGGELKGKSSSIGENKGGGNDEQMGKKKKKGGDGEDEAGSNKNTAQKNVAPVMIETGYSLESADYATHLFSDENTESCSIM